MATDGRDKLPLGEIVQGDALEVLRGWPDGCVQLVVTSPPYWNLRDYQANGESIAGQWGREPTPAEHVQRVVELAREVRRVLRPDGVLVLNYGEGYAQSSTSNHGRGKAAPALNGRGKPQNCTGWENPPRMPPPNGMKPKDLLGMPWEIARALRADGWWWRCWWPWVKLNGMPGSEGDRPVLSVETMLMFTASGRPLYWTHAEGRGARTAPPPDYRWTNQQSGIEVADEPPGWRTAVYLDADGQERRLWKRRNLWEGHHYYWDQDAIRVGYAPASIERADGSRVTTGNPDVRPGFKRTLSYSPVEPTTLKGAMRADGSAPYRPNSKETGGVGSNPHNGRIRKTGDWWRESVPLAIAQVEAWLAHARAFERGETPVLLDFDGLPVGQLHPTYAYPGSHFATFPPDLVRPVIRAATSEAGACPACGAPWVREVERGIAPTKKAAKTFVIDERDHNADKQDRGANWQKDGHKSGYISANVTTGWHPSCDCHAGEPVPCVVLDPFAGTGTTCVVAAEEGRATVGIDLYGGHYDFGGHTAMDRLRAAMGTGAPLEQTAAERAGQVPLFDETGD